MGAPKSNLICPRCNKRPTRSDMCGQCRAIEQRRVLYKSPYKEMK